MDLRFARPFSSQHIYHPRTGRKSIDFHRGSGVCRLPCSDSLVSNAFSTQVSVAGANGWIAAYRLLGSLILANRDWRTSVPPVG